MKWVWFDFFAEIRVLCSGMEVFEGGCTLVESHIWKDVPSSTGPEFSHHIEEMLSNCR